MKLLFPAIESIQRAYAGWLSPEPAREAEPAGFVPADGFVPESKETGTETLEIAPVEETALPETVADAIHRQTAARPAVRSPEPGDLILLPPRAHAGTDADPTLPLLVLLDEQAAGRWHGWLVGAHVDYAGDRDLVLDASLLEGDGDPAPLAGMVFCWNRLSIPMGDQAWVLHRLTPAAMEAVRALEQQAEPSGLEAAPGHMCTRELGQMVVMTGSPYLRDDPRTPYLRMTRELARRISEYEFDDEGRARRPGRDEPEK